MVYLGITSRSVRSRRWALKEHGVSEAHARVAEMATNRMTSQYESTATVGTIDNDKSFHKWSATNVRVQSKIGAGRAKQLLEIGFEFECISSRNELLAKQIIQWDTMYEQPANSPRSHDGVWSLAVG
jgi:hypothetical protein